MPYINDLMNSLNQLNPQDIYIDDISQGFTNAALGAYGENVNQARNYTQLAGATAAEGYRGYNDILNQTANRLEGTIPTYDNIAAQYGQGASAMQGLVNQGANMELQNMSGMLNMYRRRAGQTEMPGQRLLEQSLGASSSQALNRIKEYGGSSQGVLGALSNVYGSQQQQLRNQALSNAQWQDQNMQNYMGATESVGKRYGDVYNRMGAAQEAATNMTQGARERALASQQNIMSNVGQLRATGQEAMTTSQANAAQGMAGLYQNLAPQTTNVLMSLQQQRLSAEQQQADLRNKAILNASSLAGQGLQNTANYQDYAWQQNQLNPYNNWMNYNSMYGTQDVMSGQTQNAMNNAANMAYNQYAQNQAANAQLWGGVAGLVGNVGTQWWMNNQTANNANSAYTPVPQAQFNTNIQQPNYNWSL